MTNIHDLIQDLIAAAPELDAVRREHLADNDELLPTSPIHCRGGGRFAARARVALSSRSTPCRVTSRVPNGSPVTRRW